MPHAGPECVIVSSPPLWFPTIKQRAFGEPTFADEYVIKTRRLLADENVQRFENRFAFKFKTRFVSSVEYHLFFVIISNAKRFSCPQTVRRVSRGRTVCTQLTQSVPVHSSATDDIDLRFQTMHLFET